MTKSMTSGGPARLIFLFTLPLLGGNLFQQFYNMMDTLIVGRTLGVNALASVGCTGSIVFLIIGFAQGVSSGLAIVTARYFGAEDYDGVRRSFAANIVIGTVVIHDYDAKHFIGTTFLTIIGIAIVVFLMIMIIMLVQQLGTFLMTVFTELTL